MSELVDISVSCLESGEWHFCDLQTEESFVNYAEKMVGMLFEPRQCTLVTNLELARGGIPKFQGPRPVRSETLSVVHCSVTLTIKRDPRNHMPILIVATVVPAGAA